MDKPSHSKPGPLAGVRILDLTGVVFGPLATQILGDMGAEIIKVEGLAGDGMRANGVSQRRGMSSIFLAVNRNKRSIALDLKSEQGREVLRRMIPSFDIFVHNMRTQAIGRLGFGYDDVRALHPSMIYCAATGFGQDGPHRDRPAFDDIIQSACGLTALNGIGHAAPDYVPSLIADKTAGLALATAMLGALVCKDRTGVGQYVEVPMFETLTSFVLAEHLGGLTFDGSTQPAGYQRILTGGRRARPTASSRCCPTPKNTGTPFLRSSTARTWRPSTTCRTATSAMPASPSCTATCIRSRRRAPRPSGWPAARRWTCPARRSMRWRSWSTTRT